jgi:hypothetical protein
LFVALVTELMAFMPQPAVVVFERITSRRQGLAFRPKGLRARITRVRGMAKSHALVVDRSALHGISQMSRFVALVSEPAAVIERVTPRAQLIAHDDAKIAAIRNLMNVHDSPAAPVAAAATSSAATATTTAAIWA